MEYKSPQTETKEASEKYDVRITNGHVSGKFNFTFKQKIFNCFISLVVTMLGGHGWWSHNRQSELESALADNQRKTIDCEAREIRSAVLLQQLGFLLEPRSMSIPTSLVGTQDTPKPEK